MDLHTEEWQAILIRNDWHDFERIWALELDAFQTPARIGSGWSSVSKAHLELADGSKQPVFIKRQENYLVKAWNHPFGGIPTLRKELNNINRCQKINVPTIETIYYGERRSKHVFRAILISLALEGYQPLETLLKQWKTQPPSSELHHLMLLQLAILVRRLHENHLVHKNLSPEHIFVDVQKLQEGQQDSMRLLDLKNMRFELFESSCRQKDLDHFLPYTKKTDLLRFLYYYFGEQKVTRRIKKTWRMLTMPSKKSMVRNTL